MVVGAVPRNELGHDVMARSRQVVGRKSPGQHIHQGKRARSHQPPTRGVPEDGIGAIDHDHGNAQGRHVKRGGSRDRDAQIASRHEPVETVQFDFDWQPRAVPRGNFPPERSDPSREWWESETPKRDSLRRSGWRRPADGESCAVPLIFANPATARRPGGCRIRDRGLRRSIQRKLIEQGMADKRCVDPMPAKILLLERQDAGEAVNASPQFFHSPLCATPITAARCDRARGFPCPGPRGRNEDSWRTNRRRSADRDGARENSSASGAAGDKSRPPRQAPRQLIAARQPSRDGSLPPPRPWPGHRVPRRKRKD